MTPTSTLQKLGIQSVSDDGSLDELQQVLTAVKARAISTDTKVVYKTKRVGGKLLETSCVALKITVQHDSRVYYAKWVFDKVGKMTEFNLKY